jgi:hypothetical protein
MKFKEFLKEENQTPLEKFVDQYSIDAYDDDHHLITKIDDLLNADRSGLNFDVISLSLGLDKSTATKFDPPIGRNDWGNLREFGLLSGPKSSVGERHVIDDFSKMPNVEMWILSNVDVKSLKDITEAKHLKKITIHVATFDCGLLSLLKLPNLDTIDLYSFVGDDDVYDALAIVSDHLESRDIVECMDALIEKGLKKYAKL